MKWYLYPSGGPLGAPVATGLNATLSGGGRAPGLYLLELHVTDSDGATVERIQTLNIDPDPANLPPVVTITEPVNGETRQYEGTPVRFSISATASDPEDGSIPFGDIQWTVSVNGGASQPLNVESFQFCFDPPTGPPSCGPIEYYVDLLPDGSSTTTQFDIKATVQDSTGQTNANSNGRVTVFITQLI